MNIHHTKKSPVLIRKRDWLALPEDCRGIGANREILVKSGNRMVEAQIIP